MTCKNNLNVSGSVERTTKDSEAGAIIIIRERRCAECNQIHKTTEYSHDELYRKQTLQYLQHEELMKRITDLEQDLRSYNTLMNIIKNAITDSE